MNKTKLNDGRVIEHLDVIHNTGITRFGWWDRIKILLGRKLVVNTTIFTRHERVDIVATEAKSYVEVLIRSRKKSGGIVAPNDNDIDPPKSQVFFRPECTYNHCPDAKGCNKNDKCKFPRSGHGVR